MGEALLALMAYLFLCEILRECGPAIGHAIAGAFEFLGEVLEQGIRALVRGIFRLIAAMFRLLWRATVLGGRGIGFAFTFLFYLAAEWIRGEPSDETAFEFDEEEPDEEDLVQAALQLFSLADDFTRASLDAAFKHAMKKAHPDVGGSLDEAQAVNTARDLLMRRRGWA